MHCTYIFEKYKKKERKKDKVKCAKDSRKDFNLKMIDF